MICRHCGDGSCIYCNPDYFLYDEYKEEKRKHKERVKLEVKKFKEWQNRQEKYYRNRLTKEKH